VRRLPLPQGEEVLVRFENLKSVGLTLNQISENFSAAVRQSGFELVNNSDTRATIRKSRQTMERSSGSVKVTPVW